MLLHYLFCFLQLATGQSIIPREFNLRLQPELGLTFRADNVNMFPRLLPREERMTHEENGFVIQSRYRNGSASAGDGNDGVHSFGASSPSVTLIIRQIRLMVRYWTLFQANLPCETSPFISRTEVTERIGAGTVSRIQLHDSFPATGCGHTHYPNFDVTRDVAAAPIYAQSLTRMWSLYHEPTR